MFEPVEYDLGEMSGALIKVVGVGGGGGNAINHMVASVLERKACSLSLMRFSFILDFFISSICS